MLIFFFFSLFPFPSPERTTSPGTIPSKISKSPEPRRTTMGNDVSLVDVLVHFTTESPVCQLLCNVSIAVLTGPFQQHSVSHRAHQLHDLHSFG